MTTENDYLVMAKDCADRINEKNKELDVLKNKNRVYLQVLADIKHFVNNILTIYSIINELGKSTRIGAESVCLRKLSNCLQDIDLAYQSLNEQDDYLGLGEEMDMLTRLTIAELS
tara:strand:- start:40 stop:384 length:345 start_codon:yes stop_codon:yes gene_type:complete